MDYVWKKCIKSLNLIKKLGYNHTFRLKQGYEKMQNDSEKQFLKLMNYKVGKSVGNIRRHRDIKLVKTEARRNYLLSEPNYYITTLFPKNFLNAEIK